MTVIEEQSASAWKTIGLTRRQCRADAGHEIPPDKDRSQWITLANRDQLKSRYETRRGIGASAGVFPQDALIVELSHREDLAISFSVKLRN